MSDSGKAIFPDFGKLVPGFDFLQNLTRQAGDAAGNGMPKMPSLGSWVAPTLNVEELDRRIEELKAVQFWLDQNATALKATIQALEVQKMTLSALQGMNVNMADMAKAFQVPEVPGQTSGVASGMAAATDLVNTMASNMASSMANMSTMANNMAGMAGKPAQSKPAGAQRPHSRASEAGEDKPHHQFAGLEVPQTGFMRREQERDQGRGNGAAQDAGARDGSALKEEAQDAQEPRDPAAEAVKAGAGMAAVIDPLQWWGALTQQFQTIANSALQDVSQRKPFEASQTLAQDALRTASRTASDFAESASKSLAQGASNARDLMTGALNVGEGWPVPGAPAAKGKAGASRAGGSTSRKAAPARASAKASDDKASGRGKAGAKKTTRPETSKSAGAKATTGRARKADGTAEGKSSRSAASAASGKGTTSSNGRSAARSSAGSRSGKARGVTATRKAAPRTR